MLLILLTNAIAIYCLSLSNELLHRLQVWQTIYTASCNVIKSIIFIIIIMIITFISAV